MADISKYPREGGKSFDYGMQLQEMIRRTAEAIPTFPRVEMPDFKPLVQKDHRMADTFYERLRYQIEEIEKELAGDEQLAVVHYNSAGQPFMVRDIGYHNPNLIILYGQDADNNECSILAHMNTIQLVLIRVKVKEVKPYRIGFLRESGDGNAADET